ncbi:hypothetical protein ACFYTQ_36695 [Nocardia sp. NPDC004068]|uniref:hypothetical protein n=1 Tax=Nocardia sp. NPDC004068 TaxID=3364303 RepID=UPI0036760F6C
MADGRPKFADITPDSATTATDTENVAPARPLARRPRRWVVPAVGAAALVLCGLVVLLSCRAHTRTGGEDAAIRAAHGPTTTRAGVPAGYAHDKHGAATAGVNTVQALTQAGQGRVSMDAVVAAVIARDPGPQLRKSIEVGKGRSEGRDVVNMVPAAVTVTSYSASTAEVSVWTMVISRGAVTDNAAPAIITAWSTHTVDLVWEAGDWKAKEVAGHVGPTPDQTVSPGPDSPLAQPVQPGYYSFYIN